MVFCVCLDHLERAEAGGCVGVFAVHLPVYECVCVSVCMNVWLSVCENSCVRKTCWENLGDVYVEVNNIIMYCRYL